MTRAIFAALAIMLLSAAPAPAEITRVEANPQSRELTYNGASEGVTTTWKITRKRSGGPFELRSAPGRLRLGTTVEATTAARAQPVSGNPDTVTFSETITIPQKVLDEAQGQMIVFERDFSDNIRIQSVTTGRVMIMVKPAPVAPTGTGAAPALASTPPATAEPFMTISPDEVRGELDLSNPGNGDLADNETTLRWEPVATATGYQVQILDDVRQQVYLAPVSGTELPIIDFARKIARAKTRYQWRVAANDASGAIIAISPTRVIWMWSK